MHYRNELKALMAVIKESGIAGRIMQHVLYEYNTNDNDELNNLFVGTQNEAIRKEMLELVDKKFSYCLIKILGDQNTDQTHIDWAIAAIVRPLEEDDIFKTFTQDHDVNPITKHLFNTILRQTAEVFLKEAIQQSGNSYWEMTGFNNIMTHVKNADFAQYDKELIAELAAEDDESSVGITKLRSFL